jgi:hypothetical protein
VLAQHRGSLRHQRLAGFGNSSPYILCSLVLCSARTRIDDSSFFWGGKIDHNEFVISKRVVKQAIVLFKAQSFRLN